MFRPATKKPFATEFPIRMFVYGTLMQGMSNNGHMEGCKFVCTGAIDGLLIHLGGFPGLIEAWGAPRVIGEVWEVPNQEILDRLDHLEGTESNFYRRMEAWVEMEPEKIYAEKKQNNGHCHVYVYQHYKNKDPVRVVWPSKWAGPKSTTRLFLGFFDKDHPIPRHEQQVLAHYNYLDTGWRGLVWADRAEPLSVAHNGNTKPSFKFNLQDKTWEPNKPYPLYPQQSWSGSQNRYPVPSSQSRPYNRPTPPPQPVEFKDDSDPGEEDAPERSVA